jgi:glucose dehydrogenase
MSRRQALQAAIAAAGGLSITGIESTAGMGVAPAGEWSTFQYDLANTGYNPHATGVKDRVNTQWKINTGNGSSGSPIIRDGTIYIANHHDFNDDAVYAFNASNGEGKWVNQDIDLHNSVGNSKAIGAPAVDDDTLYVGLTEESIYALHNSDGSIKWKHKTNNPNNIVGYPSTINHSTHRHMTDTER